MSIMELNNVRKDVDGKIKKHSPVVEVFSAMAQGKDLAPFGKAGDLSVKYIKGLAEKAGNGDFTAVSELNTMRRFVVEAPLMEEIKLLSVFGSYTPVAWDETIEREVYNHVGEKSREQAAGGDVVFSTISKEVYPVNTFTVSGGYEVDYRRLQLGDMSKENEGMEQVRIDIRNKAARAIVLKIFNAIKNAKGVKYQVEEAGLTKTNLDALLTKIRRFGKPTIIGDYALLSQITPFAGYVGKIDSNTILGVSQNMLDEILQNGILGMYNGSVLSEMPNPYDLTKIEDGNFTTLLPMGLGFVIPTGVQSPIATYTRGGLTSFTGNDVKTGKLMTRFDLEVGADIAKGQEYRIGTIYDTNLGGLE